MGLRLREAMLLNGILFNSEAWSNVTKEDMRKLELVDQYLLKSLVDGHSKTSCEFQYLEFGIIGIPWVVKSRRLNYYRNIIQRDEKETLKKVLRAQQVNPTRGDWWLLVKKDFEDINLEISEAEIMKLSEYSYKKLIKEKVREAAFQHYKTLQSQHSKISHIQYSNFEVQPYLVSQKFTNKQCNTLYRVRSRTFDV